MANQTSQASATTNSRLPPKERFWKYYSPHYEFPLSTGISFLLHALVLTVLIVGSIMIAKLSFGEKKLEVGVIAIPGEDGTEGAPAEQGVKREAPRQPVEGNDRVAPKPGELKPPSVEPPPLVSAIGERRFEEPDQASKTLGAVSVSLRRRIAELTKGPGGDGRPDGRKGTIRQREKRQQRWVMVFNTSNGEDYAKQLASLKAILAVPVKGEEGQYLVIEDLSKRPVQPKKKDLKDINRIYWIDDKEESVASLAKALGLKPVPAHIVAFFPAELEKELLDKEFAYGHAGEDRIDETRFQVKRKPGGYEPVVTEQRLKGK